MTDLRKQNLPPGHYLCGLGGWHPAWLQKYATTKWFMGVYGLLGTIQAMSYMYFIVTLTTLEKRFKIPSQTTGIVLSGNEISQIMLSLVLSYIGGQRNRPRWIAWGIVLCGISCFILVLPHFIYGAGDEVLQLTKEYQDSLFNTSHTVNFTLTSDNENTLGNKPQQLCGVGKNEQNCDTLFTYVPLVLIFFSQFVLGVGNTLYYALGQTYLDDNTKRTNTPLMLAVAMSLRMIGPVFGFFFGFMSLNTFIDPTKTPLITNKDPRWLGAWWLGWVILGTLMCVFSGLIGLFPKQLPKKTDAANRNSHLPQVLRHEELKRDEGLSLSSRVSSNAALDTIGAGANAELPKLKDFPRALMRLVRNKLLIFNITSGVFYVLGASGFMTFLTKYMEVQFHRAAHEATVVVGPVTILGMVVGLFASGFVISKKKPSVSKVLLWNVVVGVVYILGQLSYAFLYCPDSISMGQIGKFNLTTNCNSNCSCESVNYSPVCHVASDTTYFSPCHAGCTSWNAETKLYGQCSCVKENLTAVSQNYVAKNWIMEMQPTEIPMIDSTDLNIDLADVPLLNDDNSAEFDDDMLSRARRAVNELVLQPGICMEGCNKMFWIFSITSTFVNWFGSSGRIGNVLVNYRTVSPEDKSFAQGLALMMISLFALIPGPIIFGRIIDSTCLVWTKTCHGNGNCQLYDQTSFRYSVNFLSCLFTFIGVIFDWLVWYYGRGLDLYGDKEAKRQEQVNRRDQPITPLLAKKAIQADY